MYMWQSQVENAHYSVAYLDCITAFRVPYLRTSVKGGAHTFYLEVSNIEAPTRAYGSLIKGGASTKARSN